MDCSNCGEYATAKPPIRISEQLDLLERRGMRIDNREYAHDFLRRTGYARLRPYWYHFEGDPTDHTFKPGTQFEDVTNLYFFDEQLCAAAFEALARIEVAFRAAWIDGLAVSTGDPFGYLGLEHYHNIERFRKDVSELGELWAVYKRRGDPPVIHYLQNYCEDCPPVWFAGEAMSFGLLSRFYANLKLDHPVKRGLAAGIGLHPATLSRVMRAVVVFRNHVFHHARIWDRKFTAYTVSAKTKHYPRRLREALSMGLGGWQQTSYTLLTLAAFLEITLASSISLARRFVALMNAYNPPIAPMGVPKDFAQRYPWRDISS